MRGPGWAGLGLLLFAALAVRVGGAIWWQARLGSPQAFFFPDSHSYWHLARTIAFGQPYQYGSADARVFRMPGYPAVLAPIFWLAGPEPPVLWGRMVGAVFGMIPVGCCWWLGRRMFGPTAGWWAGSVAAFYPEAIAASVLILSEALFCPVLCLQLVMLLLVWQNVEVRKTLGYGLVCGLLGGLGTLVRPSWFWFTPLTACLAILVGKRSTTGVDSPKGPSELESRSVPASAARSETLPWMLRLARAGTLLAGMILAMAPWWIRNYRVIGRFVPTTLQVGASLYDGLHPGAGGGSDMRFVQEFADSERWLLNYRGPKVRILEGAETSAKSASEAEANTSEPSSAKPEQPTVVWEYWLDWAMTEEALRWARRHPQEVLRLAWKKLRRMWNPWPNEPALASWPMGAIVAGSYLPVLGAGLLGLVHCRRQREMVLLVLPALYLSLVHCVFVSSVRYRGPAMFGWMVLGAGWLAEKIRSAGPAQTTPEKKTVRIE